MGINGLKKGLGLIFQRKNELFLLKHDLPVLVHHQVNPLGYGQKPAFGVVAPGNFACLVREQGEIG